MRLGELADLHAQLGVRSRTRYLELLELAVNLLQRLLDRLDDVLDSLLSLFELLSRPLLQLFELSLGKVEKRLVVRGEGVRGERLHRVAERFASLSQESEAGAVMGSQEERRRSASEHEPDQESYDHWGVEP